MKARIICMASAKGGSGKTVLTATFGQFLTTIGKKVLLVDTDASTNGLTLLYFKEVMTQAELLISKKRKPVGVYQSHIDSTEVSSPEVINLSSGVDLIPATYEFQNTDVVDIKNYIASIIDIKNRYRGGYDYIFLDAQAGSDSFAKVAMSRNISDEVVIVSEYDPLSAAGIERLKGLFREDLTYDRTWILLNKMLPEFVQSFSDFMEVARYLSPIPWNASVVMAYARRKLALDMDNVNSYTLAVMQVLRSLLGNDIEDLLKDWSSEKKSAMLEPVKEKYNVLQNELNNILALRQDKTQYTKNRKKSALILFGVVSMVTLIITFSLKAIFWDTNKYINIPDILENILVLCGVMAPLTSLFGKYIESDYGLNQVLSDEKYSSQRIEDLRKQIDELEVLKAGDINFIVHTNERIAKEIRSKSNLIK